ncbi:hypothetical protein ACR75N_04815 [Parabacteroides merdae]|uniref:hypothetical protein n=1 Tax=Parabacteroides merdae TaxID=46503 RepID=UPI003DA57184
MNENKIIYSTTLPTAIWEMFSQRIIDYRFRSVGDTLRYLFESYIRMSRGLEVSKTVKRIFTHKGIDWINLFRYEDKTVVTLVTNRELANDMSNLAVMQGYRTRNQLSNDLIGAFVGSAQITLKSLSLEVNKSEIVTEIQPQIVATYVSNYQYVFLASRAKDQRCNMIDLIHNVVDMFIQIEENDSSRYIPEVLSDMANDVLNIEGYTTKDFRRDKVIYLKVTEEDTLKILHVMKKYNIPTLREFLRRAVLFFLNAQYIIYKENLSSDDYIPYEEPEDYESYINDQYAKQDFNRSLYSNII